MTLPPGIVTRVTSTGPIEANFFWTRIPIQQFDYGDVLTLWLPPAPDENANEKIVDELVSHLIAIHREDIRVVVVESDFPAMLERLSDVELAKLNLKKIKPRP